ncbi:MAG TPA: Holliday junction branch migration protein RuvA [Steroidobacteraceae bacterium]|nr:Holliday junction branch migration protein RuvA [Steroidobacteraceae bacterium]
MIGALAGVIAEKEPPRLLIECQGLGYEVEVPMSTYLTLPPVGSGVRLRIHHVLREDASLLYGFATAEERELFRALLKVNSVGPKVALAILSGVSASQFRQAVAAEDAAALTRIPGVGRKTAERLLVEMRDHFKDAPSAAGSAGVLPPREEALHALLALGYKPQEAQKMLEKAATTGATTEELIRGALQGAVSK